MYAELRELFRGRTHSRGKAENLATRKFRFSDRSEAFSAVDFFQGESEAFRRWVGQVALSDRVAFVSALCAQIRRDRITTPILKCFIFSFSTICGWINDSIFECENEKCESPPKKICERTKK